MFLGHAFLAFALVAAVARLSGWDAERAVRVGVLAGLFAALPDVDILYGPVGLVGGASGLSDPTAAFWETGNVVHRGPTHSVLVGAVAAVGFGLWHGGTVRSRGAGAAVLAGLVGLAGLVSGLLGALVVAAFALAGLFVLEVICRWDASGRSVALAALAGLLSHPFGDLFTGEPPQFFYPFDVVLVGDLVELHADPTLHLLGAFGVELLTAWAALGVLFWLRGRSLPEHVHPRAGLGVAYAGAAVVLPAPTLDTSYHFVFSVLSLVGLGILSRSVRPVEWYRAACTGLAAVTVAAVAYAVAYLVV